MRHTGPVCELFGVCGLRRVLGRLLTHSISWATLCPKQSYGSSHKSPSPETQALGRTVYGSEGGATLGEVRLKG